MCLSEIEKNDDGRIANARIVARKLQAALLMIDFEHGDVIAALIATVQKPSRRVEIETAWIVASSSLLADIRQFAIRPDREDADTVLKSIARVDELSVMRHQDLGAEVTSSEARWKS